MGRENGKEGDRNGKDNPLTQIPGSSIVTVHGVPKSDPIELSTTVTTFKPNFSSLTLPFKMYLSNFIWLAFTFTYICNLFVT